MAPPVKTADLLDAAVIALEHVGLKGDFALLQAQTSTNLQNLSSQVAALQGDGRAQMQILRNVEAAQHQMQAHSSAFERLAASIDRNTAENLQWRKEHEEANAKVLARVNKFQGGLYGITVLAGALFTVAVMWVNAEFSNVRREHVADIQQIQQRIETKHQIRSSP